jgi:hypothetical protein
LAISLSYITPPPWQWFHTWLRAAAPETLSAEVRALEALVCVQQQEAPLRQLLYEHGLLRPWAPLTTALLQKFFLRHYQVMRPYSRRSNTPSPKPATVSNLSECFGSTVRGTIYR